MPRCPEGATIQHGFGIGFSPVHKLIQPYLYELAIRRDRQQIADREFHERNHARNSGTSGSNSATSGPRIIIARNGSIGMMDGDR